MPLFKASDGPLPTWARLAFDQAYESTHMEKSNHLHFTKLINKNDVLF